jgi:hypothetical protein
VALKSCGSCLLITGFQDARSSDDLVLGRRTFSREQRGKDLIGRRSSETLESKANARGGNFGLARSTSDTFISACLTEKGKRPQTVKHFLPVVVIRYHYLELGSLLLYRNRHLVWCQHGEA